MGGQERRDVVVRWRAWIWPLCPDGYSGPLSVISSELEFHPETNAWRSPGGRLPSLPCLGGALASVAPFPVTRGNLAWP